MQCKCVVPATTNTPVDSVIGEDGGDFICKEEAYPDSEHCIIHMDFPNKDKESEEWRRIAELKEKKLDEKISKGDFNFVKAVLPRVNFSRMEIQDEVVFVLAQIWGDVLFNESQLGKNVWFTSAKIQGNVSFENARISGRAYFDCANIEGNANFESSRSDGVILFDAGINDGLYFRDAEIISYAHFGWADIKGYVDFVNAKLGSSAIFNGIKVHDHISFLDTQFNGDATFFRAYLGNVSISSIRIVGEMYFIKTKFGNPWAQVDACRTAKYICEEKGNREVSDYHFYREMEGRRRLKHPILRILEFPVQYLFGYGVYPSRVIGTWLSAIVIFTLFFWFGMALEGEKSILDYLYFSIMNTINPGVYGFTVKPGIYQALASAETIFGTFNWAALIATFAKKYMR